MSLNITQSPIRLYYWVGEGRRLRNVDLVKATVKAVERAGGNLATAADLRAALAEIDATGCQTGFDARMASRGM